MTIQLAASRFLALAILLFLLQALPSPADVRLPAIFGDHMVLQQDIKIPVWGWADAGEAVTVALGDKTAKTTADANGKWRVDLEPVATATTPLTLTVTGKNSLKFDDVLVGDVWICSGQSNMELPVGGQLDGQHYVGRKLPNADDPQLRLFLVTKKVAFDPETDVRGQWVVSSRATVAGFSAVGYFFGSELRQTLNRPIGLIGTYWGGTPAQAWTSLSGLQKDPPFAQYIDRYQKVVANYPKAKEDYPVALAAYQDHLKQWNETVLPPYKTAVDQWQVAYNQAKISNQPLPPRPNPPTPTPTAPFPAEWPPQTPTALYDGMVAPLIPYAIKGVAWYQGESNADNGAESLEYKTLFPRMISDWREKWNQGDFPFIYVQLANFANYSKAPTPPSGGAWPYLREAQLKTLSLPNTGMAVIIDVGAAGTIHPPDKLDVGLRLALAARHVAYKQDLVYSGPIYDSMIVEGNKIRLTFKETGSGLQMSTPPLAKLAAPAPTGAPAPTSPATPAATPTELTGFAIAGADQNFVWAKAQIDGNTVVVSSDEVASPVAVRYGWADNPACNLYNMEGLPASPFRTDDWTGSKPKPAPPPPSPAPPAPHPKP